MRPETICRSALAAGIPYVFLCRQVGVPFNCSAAGLVFGGGFKKLHPATRKFVLSGLTLCPDDSEVQTEEEKAVKVGLRRLLGMNRREWPYLAAGVAASATIGTVQPLFAVILSKATALLTPDEPASNLLRFCLYLFALGAAQLACGTLQVCR